MSASTLLASFFVLLGLGYVLRATRVVPPEATDVVRALIVDVATPALVVIVVAGATWDDALWPALGAAAGATVVAGAFGAAAAKALRQPRAVVATAALVAGFANTGFFGVPFVVAAYGPGVASTTAVTIDVVITTIAMWTIGAAVAATLAGGARSTSRAAAVVDAGRALAKRPLFLAVFVGAALGALDVELPAVVAATLQHAADATPLLVFLFLGMSLDFALLRGRAAAVALVVAAKIVVAPVVAFALCLAFGARGPSAEVAVLQSAMPSAIVSVVVAATYGGDRSFGAAVGVLATLASAATLPLALAARALLPGA